MLFVLLTAYTSKKHWKITRYKNSLARFEGRMVVSITIIIIWQSEAGRWTPTFWSNLHGRKPTQEKKNSVDNVGKSVNVASFLTLISLLPSSSYWFTAPVFHSHISVEYFSMLSLLLKYLENIFLQLVWKNHYIISGKYTIQNYWLSSSTKVKNAGSYTSISHTSIMWCLSKHKRNFTFLSLMNHLHSVHVTLHFCHW